MIKRGTLVTILSGICIVALASPAVAGPGDAVIEYNLGLAARKKGSLDRAYKLFKKACLAADGLAEACLAWGELADSQENAKDVKRALGSAVMLAPDDIHARYALAVYLLKKKDWTWAIEHLVAAIPYAETDEDRALLRYYLGYALFKNDEIDEAGKQLSLSRAHLPPSQRQLCDYYRALVAARQENKYKSFALMKEVTAGPNPERSDAANNYLNANSDFARRNGFSGQVSASLGINTRPSSAVLDDPETAEALPVLQSVFRGDAIYSGGGYTHGFKGAFTAYREQNWVELGEKSNDSSEGATANPFAPQDFNLTDFIMQAAYLSRFWLGGIEHELLAGAEGEVQLLDRVPVKTSDGYEPSEDPFQVFSWAAGGKIWWSFAPSDDVKYGARLKIEGRPNYSEEDRSSARFRLRLTHERHFLDRALRLRLLLGGRYDRSYHDPAVVKYDRLRPEFEAKLRWRTPVPRLTWVVGAKTKYNWYMNSRDNEVNTFRRKYVQPDGVSEEVAAAQEKEYYAVTRQDFEWELNTEVQLALWWRATLALTYKHFQRISNIDDAPTPIYDGSRLPATSFGYVQDVVMLDLRQGF